MRNLVKLPKLTRASIIMSETVESLVSQAQNFTVSMRPDLAQECLIAALALDENNASIMESLGECYLSTGDVDQAHTWLQKSIAIDPDSSPYKYLYLAQLVVGADSVACYEKAITILNKYMTGELKVSEEVHESALNNNNGTPTVFQSASSSTPANEVEIKRQISKAYVGIVEAYMTDLCDEADAESRCEEAVKLALEVDGESLDALQALASIRISQCRPDEAATIILDVYNKIEPKLEYHQNRPILEMAQEAAQSGNVGEDALDIPSHAFCITTGKLLMECSDVSPILAQHCVSLMSLLLNQDDEDVEVWLMLGLATTIANPDDKDSAKYYFSNAQENIVKQQQQDGAKPGDEELQAVIQSNLEMLED